MAAQARARTRARPWSRAPMRYRRGRGGAVVRFPLERAAVRARPRVRFRWRSFVLAACTVVLVASFWDVAWTGRPSFIVLAAMGVVAAAAFWAAGPGEGER